MVGENRNLEMLTFTSPQAPSAFNGYQLPSVVELVPI